MNIEPEIEKSIVEDNKIIQVFIEDDPLQKKLISVKHIEHFTNLDYHSSWESLMPIVEKIESLGYIFTISEKYCNIQNSETNTSVTGVMYAPTKKEVVFKACVKFAKIFYFFND